MASVDDDPDLEYARPTLTPKMRAHLRRQAAVSFHPCDVEPALPSTPASSSAAAAAPSRARVGPA